MIHVRSRRAEPQCCRPVSQGPGPKCCLAASLELGELQGLRLRTQEGEEVPAANQETEPLRSLAQEGQERYQLRRLSLLRQSHLTQPTLPHLQLPLLPLFRSRQEPHQQRRQLHQ